MEKTTSKRNWFAGYSYMGINFSYDSPCWSVFMFTTKKERDAWVAENEYNGSNYVATVITQKIAYQILGITRTKISNGAYIVDAQNGRPNEIELCY